MYPYNLDVSDDNDNRQVYEEMQSPEGKLQYENSQFGTPSYHGPGSPRPGSEYDHGYGPRPGSEYDHGYGPRPGHEYDHGYGPRPGHEYNHGFDPRPDHEYDHGYGPKFDHEYDYGFDPKLGYDPILEPGYEKFPYEGSEYQPPNIRPDNAKPTGPPPKYTPKANANLYAVDPRTIRGCLYSYTYVWLENGTSFWMYPTNVGRNSISGYRWTRYGWVYFGMDLDLIQSFYCVPY